MSDLELAEKLAAEHGVWHDFSRLYTDSRNRVKVMPSIEHALTTLGLWEEYCERLSTKS